MGKSIIITYLLWMLGGWFGIHHFYLRRDRQCFVWWATLGGCFGLGWVRDLWRIPEYVQDANNDHRYLEMLTAMMRNYSKPKFDMTRFLGQMVVASIFALLMSAALPEELIPIKVTALFIPYAIALGVNTVGNIGRETCSLKTACIGGYLGLPWLLNDASNTGASVLFSAIAVEWYGKGWRRTYKKKHWFKRLLVVCICCSLYSGLWTSAIYHNAYVHNKDGEKIKLKDAVTNFFNSPAWTETKESMHRLYQYYQIHGWEKLWQEIAAQIDPEGEDYSYKVLGVSSSATEEEVNKAYRNLVKQFHPDKVKDPEAKEKAAEKFMEIQKAYETVSAIKSRRAKKKKVPTATLR